MFRHRIVILLAVTLMAAPAVAQDSTAIDTPPGGLPGDAVSPWDAAEQLNTYVVDLAPLNASWGTQFLIAPIIKTSKTSSGYSNSLWRAQAISNHLIRQGDFAFDEYYFWDQPGYGVNDDPSINYPGTPIDTYQSEGNQFGVVFAELATTDEGKTTSNVIGGVVNYLPNEPERLYVARIVGAVNAANPAENRSYFGVGGVDGNGNVHFRADGYLCTGPNTLQAYNYFRVRLLARDYCTLNIIDNSGGSDVPATDWLLFGTWTKHNTPTVIPESLAGRPILMGSNFDTHYVREIVPGVLQADGIHLAPGVTDHRGNVGYCQHNFPNVWELGASVNGTAGIIGKDGDDMSRILNLWGLDANGNPTEALALPLPVIVIDNSTGFSNDMLGTPELNQFDHYRNQVPYRGGNGQVAIGKDQEGRLLAAAQVDMPLTPDPPDPHDPTPGDYPINYIAVCRYDGVNPPEWTMAGYNDGWGGKPILDGPGGIGIGQMVPLYEVTGGDPFGPSVSAPMIDSVGNVWFLSACELYKEDSQGQPYSDFDVCLLRAVYDPVNFSYELELVLELGDVFHGRNSDTDYQIRFLSIADSNSVASGTTWSGNIIQQAFNDMDISGLEPHSPLTLGGLVLCAEIVYDVNGDGLFEKGNSPDQAYNVMLYLGAGRPCCPCPGDLFPGLPDCDNIVNITDFTKFASAYSSQAGDPNYDLCADLAPPGGDGFVNVTDFTAFAELYNQPCP